LEVLLIFSAAGKLHVKRTGNFGSLGNLAPMPWTPGGPTILKMTASL
jgi:hypothetical protein